MALNTAGLNAGAAGVTGVSGFVSLHSGAAGAGGANETTAARKAATWTGSGTSRSLSAALNFTGGAASGAVVEAGLWSAVSGGTFYGSITLTGDTSFNAAGEYTVNNLTITGANG